MRGILRKIYWLASAQFGIDLRRLARSLIGIPRYFTDWASFRSRYSGPISLLPCLHDWKGEGGSTRDEYFWQDLHVARQIHRADPARHVDIGSRLDGFVAHVASFREIEVFDIRPVSAQIPGVVFRQADLMSMPESYAGCCDSLSCLHALEHFGLGRYGDPIDPQGHAAGLSNMGRMLRPGGVFYLSVPIGQARIEFNAHRIFEPNSLVRLGAEHGLLLKDFAWVGSDRTLVQSSNPKRDMDELGKLQYALGIFTFIKQ